MDLFRETNSNFVEPKKNGVKLPGKNVKNCPVYLYFSLLLEIEEPVDDSPTLDSDRQTSQVSGVHSQLL